MALFIGEALRDWEGEGASFSPDHVPPVMCQLPSPASSGSLGLSPWAKGEFSTGNCQSHSYVDYS